MSGRIYRPSARAAERDRIALARAKASRAERYLATVRPGPTLQIFDHRGEPTAELMLTLPAALTLAGDLLRAAGAAAAEEPGRDAS
jgi:hypothetical protein